MPLFSLPSNTSILDDSRLRYEQISLTYTADQTLADIAQKIQDAYTMVKGKIVQAAAPYAWPLPDSVITAAFPSYSSEQRAEWTKDQRDTATLIVEKLSLAGLYDLAGQLDPSYTEKATLLKAEATALLTGDPKNPKDSGLVGAIGWAVDQQPGEETTGSFSTTPRRTDGYSRGDCPEYSACGDYGYRRGWR